MALVYRVFPFDPSASPGEPGHPLYLHRPQGKGRLDNPRSYDTWYFGSTPEAAVGEVFGDLSTWTDQMFALPVLPNALRTLGVFELSDTLNLLDLDDARNLVQRGLRPTQVIERNRAATQSWALDVFRETDATGARRWDGVRWWSFQRPSWTIVALWSDPSAAAPFRFIDTDQLSIGHPVVAAAARTLGRPRA